MFSPNVQSNFKQAVAMGKYSSVEDICIALNEEAKKQDFFAQPTIQIGKKANAFLESFAYENGMQSRTVLPLMWSFSVDQQKLFDDGVIELVVDGNPRFVYTKVDSSKITEQ